MTATVWALISVAWMFGFGTGIALGNRWAKESQRLDRLVEDGLDEVDGLYIDRGKLRDQ